MTGRRSHPRVRLTVPVQGQMRVLREVVVERADDVEVLALSPSPGLLGERLSVDLLGGGSSVHMDAVVVDSQPVIVDSSVRYRIRLAVVDGKRSSGAGSPGDLPPNRWASGERDDERH